MYEGGGHIYVRVAHAPCNGLRRSLGGSHAALVEEQLGEAGAAVLVQAQRLQGSQRDVAAAVGDRRGGTSVCTALDSSRGGGRERGCRGSSGAGDAREIVLKPEIVQILRDKQRK